MLNYIFTRLACSKLVGIYSIINFIINKRNFCRVFIGYHSCLRLITIVNCLFYLVSCSFHNHGRQKTKPWFVELPQHSPSCCFTSYKLLPLWHGAKQQTHNSRCSGCELTLSYVPQGYYRHWQFSIGEDQGWGLTEPISSIHYFPLVFITIKILLNTLRPTRNKRNFWDDIFKCIFVNENVWMSIKISMEFIPKGPINNIPVLVQIVAWRRQGNKPLSEPMMVKSLTHICITRPQWVNCKIACSYLSGGT